MAVPKGLKEAVKIGKTLFQPIFNPLSYHVTHYDMFAKLLSISCDLSYKKVLKQISVIRIRLKNLLNETIENFTSF